MIMEQKKQYIIQFIDNSDEIKSASLKDIVNNMMGAGAINNLVKTLQEFNARPGEFFITHIGQSTEDTTFSIAYSIESHFIIFDK